MNQSALALSLLVILASCEKTEPKMTSEMPQQVQPAPVVGSPPKKEPPARIDTPENLKKLQGSLTRMDPEKAKFIAIPATPPDPKPTDKPQAAETIVKAVPAATKENSSFQEKKQPESPKTQ